MKNQILDPTKKRSHLIMPPFGKKENANDSVVDNTSGEQSSVLKSKTSQSQGSDLGSQKEANKTSETASNTTEKTQEKQEEEAFPRIIPKKSSEIFSMSQPIKKTLSGSSFTSDILGRLPKKGPAVDFIKALPIVERLSHVDDLGNPVFEEVFGIPLSRVQIQTRRGKAEKYLVNLKQCGVENLVDLAKILYHIKNLKADFAFTFLKPNEPSSVGKNVTKLEKEIPNVGVYVDDGRIVKFTGGSELYKFFVNLPALNGSKAQFKTVSTFTDLHGACDAISEDFHVIPVDNGNCLEKYFLEERSIDLEGFLKNQLSGIPIKLVPGEELGAQDGDDLIVRAPAYTAPNSLNQARKVIEYLGKNADGIAVYRFNLADGISIDELREIFLLWDLKLKCGKTEENEPVCVVYYDYNPANKEHAIKYLPGQPVISRNL